MEKYREEAEALCGAIVKLAENEDALSNFEGYLERHFALWLSKYADTPSGMVSEFMNFATMYDN